MSVESLTIPASAAAADRPAVGARERSWLAVAALVGLALALRLGYLLTLRSADHVWVDVDHYLAKGASLVASGRFAWTWDAVGYAWGGRIYALPPLFSLYLAPFAAFPGYPFNAFVGLAFVNALAIPLVVRLGARLHSERAGLLAAGLYACWGSDIAGFAAVRQELLYVPLVIAAFAALARAWDGAGGRRAWIVAGAAFGLAALCRSMPIYFVAAMAVVLVLRDRTAVGRRQALGLVGGFALLTLPYSVALSRHLGAPTLVENHGGILVAHRYLTSDSREVPAFTTVVQAIAGQAVRTPVAFTAQTLDQARSLLHVAGGRYLQDGVYAGSAAAAAAWKAGVHALFDLPWVAALVLAPLGAVLARSRPAAGILLLWALVNVGLTAVTGFGGSRLRCPFEIHVVLLAAVVLAGRWRRPPRPLLAAGVAASVALALVMVPQVQRTLAARANYGTRWIADGAARQATIVGASGANVLAARGTLDIALSNPGAQPIRIDLRVDGTPLVAGAVLAPGEHRVTAVPYGPQALAFVEVAAVDAEGRPASLAVRAAGR